MIFGKNATVMEVRDWLKKNRRKGVQCPCCGQLAKEYRRPLNSGMARSLIQMYKHDPSRYQHIPTTVGRTSAEEGKLAYWGLIQEELRARPDGGRAGYWRLTEKGRCFALGIIAVPSHAVIYNGKLQHLVGDRIYIWDALGKKFNYNELMDG